MKRKRALSDTRGAMGNALAAARANEAADARPQRSEKKSKKMVNKLLRSTTTPAGILAAFRTVYGTTSALRLSSLGTGSLGQKLRAPSRTSSWGARGPSSALRRRG